MLSMPQSVVILSAHCDVSGLGDTEPLAELRSPLLGGDSERG